MPSLQFILATDTEPYLSTSLLLKTYYPILVASFVVAVICTPIIRWVAREAGIVDHPDEARKLHKKPIAYLGGFAVLFATLVGIGFSYTGFIDQPMMMRQVPFVIVFGMVAIAFTGFIDDVWGTYSWHKTAGQLVAAAAMAQQGIGTNVAKGFLNGIGVPRSVSEFSMFDLAGYLAEPITPAYIIGVVIIAMFILGACNAANLIDGLDGLLSGVTAITAIGILAITLIVIHAITPEQLEYLEQSMPIDLLGMRGLDGVTLLGANLVIGLAVLGAVLGFLIYNFNPASIFLGDTGSLLIGYLCIVMVLLLGERGQTHLVIAGLIVFGLPIMDTALAITRRKLAGKPISEADANHIHHIFKRKCKTVKKTVFALYGLSFLFATVGVLLAWAQITGQVRAWIIYTIAAVIFGGVGIKAIRSARRYE
ncbi:MAG: MraY family glycosyltransferase [Phycisphaerales bacterium]|jgi:UDP-GlcNAc:undecaprenyl-phosphate GlcNAc-1-phosphate transferase|nr:MraY family glycosyltransferase [Phycisphaerales bacterium]